jgi:hypothetical protein
MIKSAVAYTIDNPTAFESVGQIITNIIPNIYIVAGLVFFVLLIGGGIGYMLSSGDEKAIAKSWKTITNAVIGLAIIIGSAFIIRILETILGITIFGNNKP